LSSNSDGSVEPKLDIEKLPRHVAIIMDGNGRWARKRLLNRVSGHERGSETVRQIVRACREFGISILTLYAFSTENWQRPKMEVQALMALLERFLISEEKELVENGIRLNAIGEIQRLPDRVFTKIQEVMVSTRHNEHLLLNLALSYGSRAEIVRMVQSISEKVRNGAMTPSDITEDTVSAHLYTASIPDPDLLIRTSGEMRISNFLLWQIAYSEIYITNTLWPDFNREEFIEILADYQLRERRFGAVMAE
jgi:undecaprenyl diphosphate synthase